MNDYRTLKACLAICFTTFLIAQSALLSAQVDVKIDVSDWKLVKALDGTASVFAPRQMEVRMDSIETDIGKVITVHHVLKQSTEYSPNFVFHLSYTLYPEGLIDPDSTGVVQDLLKTTVDNAILMQNAELLYSSAKNYKDHQGMIWKTRYNDGAYVMKSEIYYANDHLYLLEVGSVSGLPTGEAVDHFFTSFKIEDFAFRRQ